MLTLVLQVRNVASCMTSFSRVSCSHLGQSLLPPKTLWHWSNFSIFCNASWEVVACSIVQSLVDGETKRLFFNSPIFHIIMFGNVLQSFFMLQLHKGCWVLVGCHKGFTCNYNHSWLIVDGCSLLSLTPCFSRICRDMTISTTTTIILSTTK